MNYLIRYLIVPNFIFVIFSAVATTSRALINLDYCLVGLCSPFIGRYWAALLYLVFFILDIIAAFAPTYHLKPVIILNLFREISAFEPAYIALLFILFVVPLLTVWCLTFKRESATLQKTGLRGRSLLLVLPLCIILLDVVNGSNGVWRFNDAARFSYNLAGSGLVKVVRDIKVSILKKKIPSTLLGPSEYATSGLRDDLVAGNLQPHNIVLVIVESWGLSKDSALNKALVASLTNAKVSKCYHVRNSAIPFYGATVSAELRELYARRASDPEDVASMPSLPALLAAKGYQTIALHGFMPVFFGRNEWYPQAGFSSIMFVDDIDKLLPTHDRCGSTNFRGICDDSVPSLIKQILLAHDAANAPKFVYWLTLNSHYPYAAPNDSSKFACDKFGLSAQQQDVCNLSATVSSTMEALSGLISDPDLPPTRFIVVGDHSPPFLMRSKEGLYDNKYVPMVELIPKERETN